VGEKKPSTRIGKLEEEAREKGGSSEKLTKKKKKEEEEIYHGHTTYNGLSKEVPGHVTGLPQEEKGKQESALEMEEMIETFY